MMHVPPRVSQTGISPAKFNEVSAQVARRYQRHMFLGVDNQAEPYLNAHFCVCTELHLVLDLSS